MEGNHSTQEALVKSAKKNLGEYLTAYTNIVKHKDVKKRMLSRATSAALSAGFLDVKVNLLTHTEKQLAGLIRNMTECIMVLTANELSKQENETKNEGENNG